MDAFDVCRFEQNLEFFNAQGYAVYEVPRSKLLDEEIKKLQKARNSYAKELKKYRKLEKKVKKYSE